MLYIVVLIACVEVLQGNRKLSAMEYFHNYIEGSSYPESVKKAV